MSAIVRSPGYACNALRRLTEFSHDRDVNAALEQFADRCDGMSASMVATAVVDASACMRKARPEWTPEEHMNAVTCVLREGERL